MTHFTIQELELWLSGQLPADRSGHLHDCPACARLAREDSLLVTAVAALPPLAPRPGFEDRVMRLVRLPDPPWYQTAARAAQRVVAGRRRWVLAGGAGALSFASMAGLLIWAAANFSLLRFATGRLASEAWIAGSGAASAWLTGAAAWVQANPQMIAATALGVCGSYVVAFLGYRYLQSAGKGAAYAPARARVA